MLNKFGIENKMFKNYYPNKGIQTGSYKLAKTTQKFAFKGLSSMNPQKAAGMDNISPKFLKDSALVISSALTHVINLSITSGYVPNKDSKSHTAL